MGLFGGGKKTIGLDIGSGYIKLAVVDHSGSEPELVKVAMTQVLADAIVEGEVMDPGIVADAIKGLFVSGGVKAKSVVTAGGGPRGVGQKNPKETRKGEGARGRGP